MSQYKGIRKEASNILELVVPPEGWDKVFTALDREGKPTPQHMKKLLLLLLKSVEQLEKKL